MSRIGKRPVKIVAGVTLEVIDREVRVKGPLGALRLALPEGVEIKVEDGEAHVIAPPPNRGNRGFQGLVRSLIANMVVGVTEGYRKELEISGVGYKAELNGRRLTLHLGFTHPVHVDLPEGIDAEVNKQTGIVIRGTDRELVGRISARIRESKKRDPYKAKGVRYKGETLERKAGKAGGK